MGRAGDTIDWDGVRTLAVAVGVREAARRLGLSVDMVRKRSSREGWLRDGALRESAQRAVKVRAVTKALSPAVTTPAKAMAAELAELSGKSRLGLARGLVNAAAEVQGMGGKDVLASASNVKQVVQATALVHGWADAAPVPRIRLEVTSNVGELPPAECDGMEAEWREVLPTEQRDDGWGVSGK